MAGSGRLAPLGAGLTQVGRVGAVEFVEEVRQAHTEGVGELEHPVEGRRVRRVLDPVDRLPVTARTLGELLLGQTERLALGADHRTECQASPLDGGVRRGWHPLSFVRGLAKGCITGVTVCPKLVPPAIIRGLVRPINGTSDTSRTRTCAAL